MYQVSEIKQKLYSERQGLINLNKFPKDLTIISNTCIGGRLYHDYHKKFLSPTIDFYMEPNDFVKMCTNLKYYMSLPIVPRPDITYEHLKGFLVCTIGDLTACFGHTNSSYDIIMNKWEERKKRINYDNIVVICTDRNVLEKPFTSCGDKVIEDFRKIPYKKVIFTVKDYKKDYVQYLPTFSDEPACPEATRPSLTQKGKYILEEDGFNFEQFLCN